MLLLKFLKLCVLLIVCDQVLDTPCVANLGPVGAGNYVKMVHNGVEYADMQLISGMFNACKSCC